MDTNLEASVPLVPFQAAPNTVINHYLALLSDGQSQVVPVPADGVTPLDVQFVVSVDGDYTLTTSAIATDGTVIGTPTVSNVVTVANAPATITVQIPGVPVLSIAAAAAPAGDAPAA